MNIKKVIVSILIATVVLISTAGVYAGGINVCTHMAPDKNYPVETSVGNLRVLNSEWVRDEIPWRIIDWGGKGNFNIPDQEWTTWVDKAVKNGIKPLCILGGGNGFYQESDEYTSGHMPTYGTKSGAAKAKEDLYWSRWIGYVEFVATTFKGKIKAYQVWNEPNNKGFWPASANPPSGVTPENYAKLYIATRNAIKAIDPDAIVICGSVTGASSDAVKFTNDTLSYIKNNGGLSQIDAYSIHMYSKSSESYLNGLNIVYNGAFSKQGYTGPVWMTENGWPAVDGVSVEEQASLAIKIPIMYESFLKSHNTTGENFWYDLKNDGTNASEKEHNFGLMYNDDTPKPAYNSVKIYNKLTNDMNFVSLTKSGSNDIYMAKFQGDAGDVTYVMWTTASTSKSVTVDLPCDTSKVYDYQGNETQRITGKGSESFTVTSYPTLVYSGNTGVKFENVSYDDSKNMISANGAFWDGDTVTIELLNEFGFVVKSILANVTANKFNVAFYVGENGEYTLRVGYPEMKALGKMSGWDTESITIKSLRPGYGVLPYFENFDNWATTDIDKCYGVSSTNSSKPFATWSGSSFVKGPDGTGQAFPLFLQASSGDRPLCFYPLKNTAYLLDGIYKLNFDYKVPSNFLSASFTITRGGAEYKEVGEEEILTNSDITSFGEQWVNVDFRLINPTNRWQVRVTDINGKLLLNKTGMYSLTSNNIVGFLWHCQRNSNATIEQAAAVDNISFSMDNDAEIKEFENEEIIFANSFSDLTKKYSEAGFYTNGSGKYVLGKEGRGITAGLIDGNFSFNERFMGFDLSKLNNGRELENGIYRIRFDYNPNTTSTNNSICFANAYNVSNAYKTYFLSTETLNSFGNQWLAVEITYEIPTASWDLKVTPENGEVYTASGGHKGVTAIPAVQWWMKPISNYKSTIPPALDNFVVTRVLETIDEDEFRIESWKFTDSNGNKFLSLKDYDEINADVNIRLGKKAPHNFDLYFALYSDDGILLNVVKKPVLLSDASGKDSISVNVPNIDGADNCRLFFWDTNGQEPIVKFIDFKEKIVANKISEVVCTHPDAVNAYLKDNVYNCDKYTDGIKRDDIPKPVQLKWSGEEPSSYLLKISENQDMSDSYDALTEKSEYDIYNLNTGRKYYWTVTALDNGKEKYTTDIQSFEICDDLPRMLYIDGVINARDIGGWSTTDGKRVKMGNLFRTAEYDNKSGKAKITAEGIDTFRNVLGVKTEIDLRQVSNDEVPAEKTQSVLGNDINYYRFDMNYNFLSSSNAKAVKNVFEIFADESKYPIAYHCIAGADRTGFITYLLNGLLGVDKTDLLRDYSITNFSGQNFREISGIESAYVNTIDSYSGNTLQEKIYNYLIDVVGVSAEKLDFIIDYNTEE